MCSSYFPSESLVIERMGGLVNIVRPHTAVEGGRGGEGLGLTLS